MPTVRLHAGPVSDSGSSFGAGGGLTGTGALWDDASDATYLESIATPGVTVAEAQADLDQLILPAGATVTGVTFNVRVQQTAGSYQTHVGVIVMAPSRLFFTQYGPTDPVHDPQGILIPSSGTILDFAIVADGFDDWAIDSLDALATLLEASDTIIDARNVPNVAPGPVVVASTIRVYELSVDVTYTGDVLRQYPRGDDKAAVPSSRVWPVPKSDTRVYSQEP
jgi:hypothetical protein